ncbi:MAG TPA: glycosyltransferase family 4 protein [Gemmatales bacterium]|nr:glycosyltransferase family 4 protein [Gemmatales bacterium]HMP59320.1 glycosyltransferase family 4 protein [Gemmatales bacterium]
MRIAHFIHRFPPALGGAELYFARLSRWLACHGHHVTVFTSNALALEAFWSAEAQRLPAQAELQGGVRVERHPLRHLPGQRYALKALGQLPWPRWQAFTLGCNPVLPSLWDRCGRSARFDVVHASAFPYAWPLLCAERLARRQGIPFCLTPFLHLGDPTRTDDRTRAAYLSPALRQLLSSADRIFVQTMLERQAVLDLGLPPERMVLQGLGVDPVECTGGDRARARDRWLIRPEQWCVGHLANLSEEKGSVDLIRAALPLWEAGHRFQVLLAGPSMPNFRRFWRSLSPLARRWTMLTGPLPDETKPDFYAALDLFALPSRSDSFGLVLLEAWANGLPCVGYRAGGVAEVIRHESDGLLVPCGDVPALTRALADLMADPDRSRALGAAGRERMAREHVWDPKLQIVLSEYERLRGGG